MARPVRMMTKDGRTQSMAEWAKELGISENTIKNRLCNGWSEDQALTPKVQSYTRTSKQLAVGRRSNEKWKRGDSEMCTCTSCNAGRESARQRLGIKPMSVPEIVRRQMIAARNKAKWLASFPRDPE